LSSPSHFHSPWWAPGTGAKVIELKFFTGLTNEEIAQTLGISTATVEREWIWLVPGSLTRFSAPATDLAPARDPQEDR